MFIPEPFYFFLSLFSLDGRKRQRLIVMRYIMARKVNRNNAYAHFCCLKWLCTDRRKKQNKRKTSEFSLLHNSEMDVDGVLTWHWLVETFNASFTEWSIDPLYGLPYCLKMRNGKKGSSVRHFDPSIMQYYLSNSVGKRGLGRQRHSTISDLLPAAWSDIKLRYTVSLPSAWQRQIASTSRYNRSPSNRIHKQFQELASGKSKY